MCWKHESHMISLVVSLVALNLKNFRQLYQLKLQYEHIENKFFTFTSAVKWFISAFILKGKKTLNA